MRNLYKQIKGDKIDFKNKYEKYGSYGQEIINMLNEFDDLDYHDNSAFDKIGKFYKYIKLITPEFCYDEEKVELLRLLAKEKTWIEIKFSDNAIIDELPDFNYDGHLPNYNLDVYDSVEKLLDEIVYLARVHLIKPLYNFESLINFNLVNKCKKTSELIVQCANDFKLDARLVVIDAAFSKTDLLYDDGSGYHFFVIVTIDDEQYLIDCTYSQFFSWYENNINRLGNYCYRGCCVGSYALENVEIEKVSRTILRKGWIKATEDNLKHYLDGFVLMYRNGLYYENLGAAVYEVDYNIDTYYNFLFGDDSQLKHEGRKYLGFQPHPLKKSNFNFSNNKVLIK